MIGNGDLRGPADAVRRAAESGVSGLMMGRAALASPWIFREMRAALDGRPVPPSPDVEFRWRTLVRLAELTHERAVGHLGTRDVRWMVAKLHPLTQGLPACRQVRAALQGCRTLDELRRLADEQIARWHDSQVSDN